MLDLPLSIDSPPDFGSKQIETNRHDWGDLTCRIADGDHDAFAIYYQHFFDSMFQEATRATGLDESTCLDIVQDSMLKVIRSIKRIDNPKQLAAWSRAVVKSSAYDWLRKRNRESRHLATLIAENTCETAEELKHIENARLQWIEQQLLDQPPKIKQMFSLRYRLGWTLKRIAQSLGLQTGAVDGKLRRTIEKLKAQAESDESLER